jgi:AcrR family transcriptional regulator
MATSTRKAEPDASRRNERSRKAILRAALELLYRDGFPAMTIEGIAARAGVGKATIYRWWPGKAAVAVEAIMELAIPEIAHPDTGSARKDLNQQLHAVVDFFDAKVGKALLALIAEGQHDRTLGKLLSERLIAERRASAGEVFQRGIDRGELRGDLDVEIAIDALYGALYYRLLVSHAPIDRAYTDALIGEAFAGFERRRHRRSK